MFFFHIFSRQRLENLEEQISQDAPEITTADRGRSSVKEHFTADREVSELRTCPDS